jgi:DNA-binding YbaB/EbfC family protein
MFDMMKMMGKVKEVQEKLKAAQESLGMIQSTAESGAGMVKATVNGKKQLIQLDIDPTILKAEDKTIVQDLVIAAVNKAIDDVEYLAKDHLKKSTEGLIPNIPGLDLTGMMG